MKHRLLPIWIIAIFIAIIVILPLGAINKYKQHRDSQKKSFYTNLNNCMGTKLSNPFENIYDQINIGMQKENAIEILKCSKWINIRKIDEKNGCKDMITVGFLENWEVVITICIGNDDTVVSKSYNNSL